MKNILLLLTIVSLSFTINAQTLADLLNKNKSSYKISGEVVGLQDSTVMLAYYFGGKQYATDTAKVIKGKFTFKGKKELKGGMYLIVLSDQQYFDIIISDTHFSFKTDINDLVGAMSFKNSVENPPFYKYLTFISEMQKEVTPIREELETADEERKKMLQESVSKIDNKVKTFRVNFIKNNSNKFFSKIVLATTEIEIPESPLDSTGKPDKTFPYKFYKKHFWDYIDFSDERMLRTPIFYNKMDQYLEKLTAKHPDSINVSSDVLIELSRANDEIFQYVVSYITSTYERSKIMGMDAIFVHMVETYYITNQCDWVDSTQLVKITDRAQKIAPNLIGRKASEFLDFYGRPFMKDLDEKLHTLQEVNSKYTLLVFFGPTCGHCKKELPKIKHTLDSLLSINIDIKTFAVATEFDKGEWGKFINDQNINDWLNVADINHDDEGNPVASSDWRDKYDIYSTPVIYLLDKDKKILAKRISHKQIAEIVGRLEQ
jgi:thiol-disulfide isomerase/thioredoxin